MMLTLKQPVHYGYRTVHDLPTPPSTSRSSPPVTATQEPGQKSGALRNSPSVKGMATHRGLPLPAAMTLPQPSPQGAAPPGHSPAPGSHAPLHSQPPPPTSSHGQNAFGPLPAPPQWQGPGFEESMRNWLQAKAEEEKRRQEEEKTRQETLRLEQRRLEHEMLRTSLDRGIPPPMVPVVFAGMSGGVLPHAALEWAQQYLAQSHAPQLPPAQGPLSPENSRRDSQTQPYAPYAGSTGIPSTPGSGPGPQSGGFGHYPGPGSPPRARANTIGSGGRPLGSSLPRLSTNEMGVPSHVAHSILQQPQQSQAQQHETQSPSIYFHHWQPPTSAASSTQPATPSVDSPRKRKAAGPQQAAPPPRYRSPPFTQSTLSNPPPGRRRGHSRQRSDISSYRTPGRGSAPARAMSPGPLSGPGPAPSPGLGPAPVLVPREQGALQLQQPRTNAHSVSSLLSSEPAEIRRLHQEPERERRQSPIPSDGPPCQREND